jgi:hypothetical protein
MHNCGVAVFIKAREGWHGRVECEEAIEGKCGMVAAK